MISGINTGYNLGKAELTTSGTLGAAIEAASFGIPTIAISQEVIRDDIKFENGEVEIDFDFATKMLNKIAKIVLKKGLPEGIDLLNVNIPENPRGKPYYWIGGEPYDFDEPGSDGYELRKEHKTTVTPLKIDLTSDMSSLKEWLK